MTEQMTNVEKLKEHLGVGNWLDLTQEQTYELLKLAGQKQLTTAVLGAIVELAPTLRELVSQCFEAFRQTTLSMKEVQSKTLDIIQKGFESFDKFRVSLLETWQTANDPERVAKMLEMVCQQMVEILAMVERINADNNRSWRDSINSIAAVLAAIVAVGGTAVAAAQRRS